MGYILDFQLVLVRSHESPKSLIMKMCWPFSPAQQNFPKTSLPKSIEISRNHSLDAKGFNFDAKGFNFDTVLISFGPPSSINDPDRLNLQICNVYNTKTYCLQVLASHFDIINQKTDHVFVTPPLLGPLCSNFFDLFLKM